MWIMTQESKKLKDNYGVESWPTIIILKDYKWKKYDDDDNRTSDKIWNAAIDY